MSQGGIKWTLNEFKISQLRKSHTMKPHVAAHFPGTGLQSQNLLLYKFYSFLISGQNAEKLLKKFRKYNFIGLAQF
jgi:hypothetical protein